MPKLEIDYSNTIIYKITCIDTNITDVYVGHTTNFVQRKHAHKQSCTNQKSANYTCKLYTVIRNNGGWENWKMEIINFYNCHDHYEARKKEQEYFISLNATLNSIEPLPKPKPKPGQNPEQKNVIFPNTNLSESFHKFYCHFCDFKTERKSQFETHCLTAKHKILTNPNVFSNEYLSKTEKDLSCKCGKKYKHMSSLCAHKKNCTYQNIITENKKTEHELTCDQNNIIETDEIKTLPTQPDPINTGLIIELLKQNQEFKSLLAEQNKHMVEQNKHMLELMEKGIGNITNNNISNNTTKNKFNLNIFLNEQCKDAMNIMDFVNSLQLKLSDLERVGELGYVKGISHIVLNKLKDLDVCKRPIHCSDLKRETMYVKDENSWEKENGKNEKLTKMIKHVAHKNQRQISEWQQENPEHKDPESGVCDKFLAIVNQSMGGSTADDDENNYNKIIKNIAKEVIIDKEPE